DLLLRRRGRGRGCRVGGRRLRGRSCRGGRFRGRRLGGRRLGGRRLGRGSGRRGAGGCRGRGGRGGRRHERRDLRLEGGGPGLVALQARDRGQRLELLQHLAALALLLVDLAQLLAGLRVVGEAGDDRVELVARLVDEPVLAEDPALRQGLVY